jgi:hypothetical protein
LFGEIGNYTPPKEETRVDGDVFVKAWYLLFSFAHALTAAMWKHEIQSSLAISTSRFHKSG